MPTLRLSEQEVEYLCDAVDFAFANRHNVTAPKYRTTIGSRAWKNLSRLNIMVMSLQHRLIHA